mmetsp:Transcript_23751/g.49733  ORF Transcript_23751/g.49733 Transcript_23751/m.49733 type:complete len:526 (-) Transcript_23751:810-2387(-)
MLRLSWPLAMSTRTTLTVTVWPTRSTACGSGGRASPGSLSSSLEWSSPSCLSPTSTKAPNGVTLRTTPRSLLPIETSLSWHICEPSSSGPSSVSRASREAAHSASSTSRVVSTGAPTAALRDTSPPSLHACVSADTRRARRASEHKSAGDSFACLRTAAASLYDSGCTAVESSGSEAASPHTRRKPAACSNDLAPMPLTFLSSAREAKPCAGRAAAMAAARAAFRPATCLRSATDAVLMSTPTSQTQLCTTLASSDSSSLALTSCWYMPTPIAFGSILTSSARGSSSLRAMEAAPRAPTSRCASSALSLAAETESTDAPDSLTTLRRTCDSSETPLSVSHTNCCVSREAVPLPIATTVQPNATSSSRSRRRAASRSPCGGCGKSTQLSRTRPAASSATSLQPERKPGSIPAMAVPRSGRCSRSWRRLREKTEMAASSACAVSRLRTARRIDGRSSRFRALSAAFSSSALRRPLRGGSASVKMMCSDCGGGVSTTLTAFSFSARLIASTLCALISLGRLESPSRDE